MFASIVIVECFWRLTFLRSLRLLVASRLAFKICFLAPCLWWESENTHVYFWTSLFSIAPSFSIILPNWAICAKVFYCFDRYIVFSLRCARWFNRTTVLSVQCYSRCGSLSFHGFGLKTADFSLMESYNRIECFLLRVLTDLFYLSLEVRPLRDILALSLYCRFSGQVPLSVCLFKALIAPSAWQTLSSANRLWLRLRFSVDGLWRRRFRYCSVLGSLVLLWGRLSRLWRCCLDCLGFLGTWHGGICSSSSDLPSRSSSLAMSCETSIKGIACARGI